MPLKRITKIVTIVSLLATMIPTNIHADEVDYSDTDAWIEKCSNVAALSTSESNACQAFLQYTASQSEELRNQLLAIDEEKQQVQQAIENYQELIANYQVEIDSLSEQITDLQNQINALQDEIVLQEQNVANLKDKVNTQISNSQDTMRISKYIDILMGAKTFSDFLKIASGLADITNYNHNTLISLNEAIASLEAMQESLKASESELQTKQTDILSKQYEASLAQQEYQQQSASLESQSQETLSYINELDDANDSITEAQRIAAEKAKAEQEAKAKAEAAAAAAAAAEAAKNNSSNNNAGSSNNTSSNTSSGSDLGSQVVSYAMQFLGYPYVWAASSPSVGFDCSGLTKYVYAHFGIYLAHSSYVQENAGYLVSYDQAQPGDLVTWTGHAAIYIGNGQVINAMDPANGVKICSIWIITNGNMMIHRLW